MKLNPAAMGNSLAAVSAIFFIFVWLLKLISPEAYSLTLNAQFFGADVASLDRSYSTTSLVTNFLLLIVVSWIGGYIWATLYNHWNHWVKK